MIGRYGALTLVAWCRAGNAARWCVVSPEWMYFHIVFDWSIRAQSETPKQFFERLWLEEAVGLAGVYA